MISAIFYTIFTGSGEKEFTQIFENIDFLFRADLPQSDNTVHTQGRHCKILCTITIGTRIFEKLRSYHYSDK